MSNTCSVCRSPERDSIERALVDGTPLRALAQQFGTSASTLSRHRYHLPIRLTDGKATSETIRGERLLKRVEKVIGRCERIATRAQRSKNWGAAVAGLREVRSSLQLLAQLQGLLNSDSVVVIHKIQESFPSLSDAELHQLLVASFAQLTDNFNPNVLEKWKREAEVPLTSEVERCVAGFRSEHKAKYEPEPGLTIKMPIVH